MEGTIEQKILDRLYNRIGIFERSIGDLEDILGNIVHNLERELLSTSLTAEEVEQRVDRATLVLEERLQELERLQEKAAQLVGVDEYFEAEVARIRPRTRLFGSEGRGQLSTGKDTRAPAPRSTVHRATALQTASTRAY